MLNITYYFCVDIITVYYKSYTMALAFEQILLIVLLVGIILIFLTRLFPDKKKDRSTETKKGKWRLQTYYY